MRISGWSSDVCSSDLPLAVATGHHQHDTAGHGRLQAAEEVAVEVGAAPFAAAGVHVEFDQGVPVFEIGRASCRERGCQDVKISVVAESLTINKKMTKSEE